MIFASGKLQRTRNPLGALNKNSSPLLVWERNKWLLFVTLILIAVSTIGVPLGLASHGDSRAIFEISVPAIQQGHYVPSRSYGNPLYELIATGLYLLGGLELVNSYSLALAFGSVAIFAHLLKGSPSGPWALAAFALNPLFLIHAVSPTEWSQATFALVSAIALLHSWLNEKNSRFLIAYAAVTASMLLTRPDFAAFSVALYAATVWQLKRERSATALLTVTTAIAWAFSLAVFALLNGGFGIFSNTVLDEAPLMRRMTIAILGVLNIFGTGGILVIVMGACHLLWLVSRGGSDVTFFEKLFIVTWPIVFIRYVTLTNKLEYVIPLIPVSLLCFSSARWPRMTTPILATFLIVNSFVSLSFFTREGASDRLKFDPQWNEGALFQDFDQRRAVSRIDDPDFMRHVASAVYQGSRPSELHWDNYLWGFESGENDLVISEDQLYKFGSARFKDDPRLRVTRYRNVYVCNKALIAENGGWRVLQPALAFVSFESEQDGGQFKCRLEYQKAGRQ